MKKITFILFALIAGTTFAQGNATAIGNAAADIVSPISITPEQVLNFGKVANNTAGVVTVSPDGVLSESSISQIGTTAPTAATFDVSAADGFSYIITLPESATLTNGTVEITVDNFTHNGYAEDATSVTGSGSLQTIGVGATLNVASNQATGEYTGEYNVTVSYE